MGSLTAQEGIHWTLEQKQSPQALLEQSHFVGGTCFVSSDSQAHLPRDNRVLVDPCFEVFVPLLENLDLLLQDNVLFHL